VSDPSSFKGPEFLQDLEFISDQISLSDPSRPQSESQLRSTGSKSPEILAGRSPEGNSSSNDDLELACLATGATAAAIALARGGDMVCHATTGPHAPEVGVCLNPRAGLSGACIQTRQLQQCSDTETDPRVDAEACRRLGVRSIVVLPLIHGDDLLGIFEILSSRPNAFGERDLNILQFLAHRIVENRRQDWQTAATESRKESAALPLKLEEVVPREKGQSSLSSSDLSFSELDSEIARRKRISRRTDIRTTALNALVIASAVLLGTLVGWRLGWQKATFGFHASSLHHRASAPSQDGQTEHPVLPGKELQTSSALTDECGQSAATALPVEPPSGGLTVCQGGQVIFRLPPSGPAASQGSQTLPRSPGVKAAPAGR
jgi:GAF domain